MVVKRYRWIVLGALGLALALWALSARRGPSADRSHDGDSAPVHGAAIDLRRQTQHAIARAGTGAGAGVSDAGLEPLDCTAPTGDVATVDDDAISAASFCAEWRRLSGPLTTGDPGVMDRQGKALLEKMIDARLLERALREAGLGVTEREVDDALDEVVAKAAAPSDPRSAEPARDARQAFESALHAQGSDVAHVRAELRQRLSLAKLVERAVPPETTEAEIRAAYAADPLRWGTPKRARVEGFIARATEAQPAHVRARAEASIRRFASEVATEPPESLARSLGLSPVAAFEATTHDTEPQLAAAALALAPGQWSQPVRSRAGWVVLRLIEARDGQTLPLHEAHDQVRVQLLNQRRQQAAQRALSQLRSRANIRYLQW